MDSATFLGTALVTGFLIIVLALFGGLYQAEKNRHECKLAAMQVYLDSAHINQICGK